MVLTHAQALLTSSPEGQTDYIQADLRDTDTILKGAARTLDLTRPVAVLLIAVLHFVPDADDPYAVVTRLMDAVPSGSYLAIAHAAADIAPEASAEMARRYNQMASATVTPRTRDHRRHHRRPGRLQPSPANPEHPRQLTYGRRTPRRSGRPWGLITRVRLNHHDKSV